MNSPKKAGKGGTALQDRLAAWADLLDRCDSKPTRKRVHALRVVTLRLQAELERDLSELPHASHQAQAMLRFGKQAEKLRQALGPVREIDVWISQLNELRASLNKPGEYTPRSMQECLQGADRLEDRLTKDRRSAAKALVAAIEKKKHRFRKAEEELEVAWHDLPLVEAKGIAAELVGHFDQVRAEFPVLEESNLHDFRKRIKTVRYLAEIHARADRECARIATQMKKLQGAIGEWHDWQALAGECRRGNHGWSKPLAELLDSIAKETFATAVEMADSVTARMVDKSARLAAPQKALRKPPQSDTIPPSTPVEENVA